MNYLGYYDASYQCYQALHVPGGPFEFMFGPLFQLEDFQNLKGAPTNLTIFQSRSRVLIRCLLYIL